MKVAFYIRDFYILLKCLGGDIYQKKWQLLNKGNN